MLHASGGEHLRGEQLSVAADALGLKVARSEILESGLDRDTRAAAKLKIENR